MHSSLQFDRALRAAKTARALLRVSIVAFGVAHFSQLAYADDSAQVRATIAPRTSTEMRQRPRQRCRPRQAGRGRTGARRRLAVGSSW